MLVPILTAIASVVVLFVIVALMQSTDFKVSRSVKVKASTAKAFQQVNDLHLMNAWNPWLKLDPNIKQTYSGAAAGVGAVYEWDGNKNVGAGRQTIVETRPSELVRMKLEFFRPFAGVNDVQFTCVPEGDHTVAIWQRLVWDVEPFTKAAEAVLAYVAFSDLVGEVAKISESVAFPFVVIEGIDRVRHRRSPVD